MAKLKANDGFELGFLLKMGIQSYTHMTIINILKDGKPYLVPDDTKMSKKDILFHVVGEEDLINLRLMGYEYGGIMDEFFPTIEKFAKQIKSTKNEAKAYYGDWPEYNQEINFYKARNSDIVNINIAYISSHLNIPFKNLQPFPEDDVFNFEFSTISQNFISFYEELKTEYDLEKIPKRVFLSSKEAKESGDSPWDDEEELIKNQTKLETEKPVILIDCDLLSDIKATQIVECKKCLFNLLKEYKVSIITSEKDDDEEDTQKLKNSFLKEFPSLVYLQEGYYPKNDELIYLRDRNTLKLFCCMDRAVTTIWFYDYCKEDWNKAYSEILRCAENPLPITSFDDDWSCSWI
ncbi:MAG: hypothetical protein J6X78_04140 [Treponema sp.]|nr:hypothetical protein [Treponema sp.]